LFAQETRDSVTKEMAKETCDDLSATDLSKKTPDDLKMFLIGDLAKVAVKHLDDLKAIGVAMSDPQAMNSLGGDIGVQLLTSCPSFLTAMTKSPGFVNDAIQASKGATAGVVSGKLLKIVDGEFTYLQIEDANGKLEKLWWLEYFDGSNKLIGNGASELNKPIKVSYVEKEVFNSVLKDYVKIKIITRID
jgi:hypothetical protein